MTMRIFLDDIRPAPEGWTLVRWPEEVIALLETCRVEELSLDTILNAADRLGGGIELAGQRLHFDESRGIIGGTIDAQPGGEALHRGGEALITGVQAVLRGQDGG